MVANIQQTLQDIYAQDGQVQNRAYTALMAATEQPVDWADEAWDELLAALTHKDNHVRAIAAQVLSNLAKSDPRGRMLADFDRLLAVTRDERYVTARHAMQSIWKVGLAGEPQRQRVLAGLSARFEECANEKNGSLTRFDILQGMRHLYDQARDENIRAKALELIETESDPKYRKKYASLWRKP